MTFVYTILQQRLFIQSRSCSYIKDYTLACSLSYGWNSKTTNACLQDWSHPIQVIWNQMTSYCMVMITWKGLLKLSLKTIQNLHSYQSQSIYLPLDLIRFPGKRFELKIKKACMFGWVQKMQHYRVQLQCNESRRKTKPRMGKISRELNDF